VLGASNHYGMLGCSLLFDGVQPGKGLGLFIDLFGRNNSAAKMCELDKFLLDCLKAFLPTSVNDLGHRIIPERTPKLGVQFLNVSDLLAESCDLISKNP
jgi:hypothetical protein